MDTGGKEWLQMAMVGYGWYLDVTGGYGYDWLWVVTSGYRGFSS